MKMIVIAAAITLLLVAPALAWVEGRSSSPIDDAPTVDAQVRTAVPFVDGYGVSGDATLFISCTKGSTSLSISTPTLALSPLADDAKAMFRVDDGVAFEQAFSVSRDYRSAIISGDSAIGSVKKMLGGQYLLVRLLPAGQDHVDLTFFIAGIDQAISAARLACHW